MKRNVFLLCIVLFALGACTMGKRDNAQKNDVEVPDPAHNSRNSVDWAGVYKGSLPCADCEGIEVEIRLGEDLTYERVMTYLGKGDNRFTDKGTIEWADDGGRIKLIDAASPETENNWFRVGENRLIMLDLEGNPIENNFPVDTYLFEKIDNDNVITEKYWKLTEVKGAAVTSPSEGQQAREAHFILKKKDNRVIGSTGCNGMNGSYTIVEEDGKIDFSPMATTRMACNDVNYEGDYLDALDQADAYTVENDVLTLMKGETPLAKFVAVYLR